MLTLPKENFIFLETNRFDRDNQRSFLFTDPVKIVSSYRADDVRDSLSDVKECINKGYYACGFISYEAGFALEDSLEGLNKKSDFPLLWFGIYKRPAVFTHSEKTDILKPERAMYRINNLRPSISKKNYIDNIEKIKEFIRQGDTYQVNYTFKYKFNFSGSAFSLYRDLKEKQSVSYSAFIRTRDLSILSLSPELFFRKNKNSIEVRPMKGTFDRGVNPEGDRCNEEALRKSLKNRSENVMIVDLLRNDLGRISEAGTVRTERLFEVERYETLFQMISVVKSRLKKEIGLYDLFKAIFPSGSVTGAPKISTMKIINSLEKEPRNIYTGAIGFIAPYAGEAVFNVAIRTVLIDNRTEKGEMGIGSGIVYDSDPSKEFEECRLKADFITRQKKDFKLIETILWRRRKGYFLLGPHLDRLSSSAGYFGFKYDKGRIIAMLKELAGKFRDDCDYRVRLLLGRDGGIETDSSAIGTDTGLKKTGFSRRRTSSRDMFFYHKTTNRSLYDKEHKEWRKKGYFDVIFMNEKNQITEGATSNIMIKKGRIYYTPPLSCGLLDGVYRRHLLQSAKIRLKEKILSKNDVTNADEIYMINSVRGMIRVVL